jgi:hypothetical protein
VRRTGDASPAETVQQVEAEDHDLTGTAKAQDAAEAKCGPGPLGRTKRCDQTSNC